MGGFFRRPGLPLLTLQFAPLSFGRATQRGERQQKLLILTSDLVTCTEVDTKGSRSNNNGFIIFKLTILSLMSTVKRMIQNVYKNI